MLKSSHQIVLDAVQSIQPYDELEARTIREVSAWIISGAPLFRVAKPDTPPMHLVSYFVVVDTAKSSLLLVDHRKSGLLLPTGGHVEPDEDPRATVEREIMEELGVEAVFALPQYDQPLFITSTVTVGQTAGHTDVSLWYVVAGESEREFDYDHGEFSGVRWLSFEEVLAADITLLDPQMHRFTRKLMSYTDK